MNVLGENNKVDIFEGQKETILTKIWEWGEFWGGIREMGGIQRMENLANQDQKFRFYCRLDLLYCIVQVEEGNGLEHLWGIKGTGIIDGLDFK